MRYYSLLSLFTLALLLSACGGDAAEAVNDADEAMASENATVPYTHLPLTTITPREDAAPTTP